MQDKPLRKTKGRGPLARDPENLVAYLGPRGSYTEEATFSYFSRASYRFMDRPTIGHVFQTVRDLGSHGVVPVENSIEGPVNQTLDLLWEYDLFIAGEVELAIQHCLLAREGTRLKSIGRVYSHPNALGQCGRFLRTRLPGASLHEVESTSKAAMLASRRHGSAAIAGHRAAREYGLRIIAKRVQDHPNNYTRFIVLSRREAPKSSSAKTSIIFGTAHLPGALWRALEPFARGRINLTKIESRPIKSKPWEYAFYVDFEGHGEAQGPREALRRLGQQATFVKLLGSYSRSSRYGS